MENVILRTNAIPIYGFLSFIDVRNPRKGTASRGKILDCGAGGPVPPLALFQQHGFEGWGIDVSERQVDWAKQFCEQEGIALHLRKGDMRQMPFEDGTFDYVYEHYAMCHLSKPDTAKAIGEMYRVLKPGGLCFLGVISMDSRPKLLFGEEKETGEFWVEEDGQSRRHTMFGDAEADTLVSAWEILLKEKRSRYLRSAAAETSLDAWMALRQEMGDRYSQEAWQAEYSNRINWFQYAHVYFFLRKG